MKKILYIFAIVAALASCSAQQRLANILEKHPELRTIDTLTVQDTVIINDTIFVEPEVQTVHITLEDINKLDSIASTNNKDTAAHAATTHANADLIAKGKGDFELKAYTNKDTIVVTDTLYKPRFFFIPSYVTKTKEVPVIVHQMTWYQKIPFWIGILTIAIMIFELLRKFL